MSFSKNNNFENLNLLEQSISDKFNFNLFKEDAIALNISESILSEELQFNLHLDMIVNGGSTRVTEYYKNINSGKNLILERAESLGHITKLELNEMLIGFKTLLESKMTSLTESEIAGFEAALSGGEYAASTAGKSIYSLGKSLLSTLTEGGTTFGTIHLILDAIGLFGDAIMGVTGIPVGVIADTLNAIIYFVRGKWLLGTISLIAAFIPFGGDALKVFKGVAGPMEKVLVTTATKGSSAGAQVLAKSSVKEQGLIIKGLRFIAKNITGVIGKAQRVLSLFFSSFLAKISGWIPFIGKPLSKFFDNIGQVFSKYSDNMKGFSTSFGKVEKEVLEVALKQSNSLVSSTLKNNGKMVLDPASNLVNCYDRSGRLLGQFSPELLTNPKILNSRYPNLFNLTKDPQGKQIIKYYNAAGSSNEKISKGLVEEFTKRGWKGVKRLSLLSAFIGKQLIKLSTGKTPEELGIPEEEVEYRGNTQLLRFIHDRIEKRKKETGAVYIPAVDLDSSEEEVFKEITDYQNNLAKLYGQPEIIPVIYDKYGNAEIKKQFEEFWDAVASGKISSEDLESADTTKEKNESFKHIIPFYKFI